VHSLLAKTHALVKQSRMDQAVHAATALNKSDKMAQRLRAGVVGAALAVVTGLLFLSAVLGQRLADLSFDLPFRWRPNQPVKDVMIIYMDEDSAKELGQPWGGGNWDRTNHAQLLTRLASCHAKAVVFDVRFAVPTTNDGPFINAIQAAQRAGTKVILGGEMNVTGSAGNSAVITNLLSPATNLENVAVWGLAEWTAGNQPLRRHFEGAQGAPSLAMRTAEMILPAARLPGSGDRWINFYGPPGSLDHRSYFQALNPNLTASTIFADKVCFVGGAPGTPYPGGSRGDEWNTPYSRLGQGPASGVEMTATVYLNLVRGDWLRRLSLWSELGALVASGILFGFGLSLCRPTVAAASGIAAAVAVAAAAGWLMWHQQLWFSWLIVAGVQIPVAVVWSTLAYTRRLAGEKALLESKLATQAAAHTANATGRTTVVAPSAPPVRPPGWTPAIPDHTLLRCVGRGGYGEVWLARNAIGSFHAVKIVRRELFGHAAPFEREFRGLQKFMPISRSHPGLVQILHVGRRDAEGFIYYVMEPADDETTGPQIQPDRYSPKNLFKEISRRGHLPVAESLQLGLDLAAALEFLHQQQLIHRDIKPANIIFVKSVPKLADIGLVAEIASTGETVSYVGTKGYIAPEGPGTTVADLYSLGKVLYEASMGLDRAQFPELPPTIAQRPDRADLLKLNTVVLKACRLDPAQRFQSATELRQELLRCRPAAAS
jgi:CHASE2 domain-containing sensor protein